MSRMERELNRWRQLSRSDHKETNVGQWLRSSHLDPTRIREYELELPELGSIWIKKWPHPPPGQHYSLYKVTGTRLSDQLQDWVITAVSGDQVIEYTTRALFYAQNCPLQSYTQNTGIRRKQFDYTDDQVCNTLIRLYSPENANQMRKKTNKRRRKNSRRK